MERAFIDWLQTKFAGQASSQPGLAIQLDQGIGDDAAVLRNAAAGRFVVTTDLLMEGTDFRLETVDPRRIGRKALAINLSDLAAMATAPVAAFVSLAIPRSGGLRLAQELIEGMLPLAEEFAATIAGGDTNSWDGPLVISVTAIGQVTERGPLLRSRARPGDAILVTGEFGGSILGHHFDFMPRVREARRLHHDYQLHAGMDVSDGLTLDLFRLAAASECGAELDLAAVPIAAAAHELAQKSADGLSPLDHALGDGEDFELLLAVPAEEAERILAAQPLPVKITRVGTFVAEPGLWSVAPDGQRDPLTPRGYEH